VYRGGIDPVKEGVSCRQLIEQLVQANPAWMERLAIGAFTARHNVVKVNADGVQDDGTRLQDLPGIRTALGLLGIAETEWQDAIRGALERLADNNVRLDQDIPLAQVVTQLAADPAELADLRKRRKNALRAFNGTQDVSLLKTWEFTLAGASQLPFQHLSRPRQWSVAQLGHGIFHGEAGEHENSMEKRAPGLYPLHDQSQLFVDDLQLEREFEDIDVGEVRDRLFSEITSTMRQRFTYDMDMNCTKRRRPMTRPAGSGSTMLLPSWMRWSAWSRTRWTPRAWTWKARTMRTMRKSTPWSALPTSSRRPWAAPAGARNSSCMRCC
jgi:hypothetical protein